MSFKRILGTILASRLGGRGRHRGPLGSASMLTGMHRRRSSGTAGLAALGYMAYKAYQDRQSSRTGTAQGKGTGTASGRTDIEGMVQGLLDRVTGGATSQSGAQNDTPDDPAFAADASAAENLSDETALLLIRAMVTAAYSDGALDTQERARIVAEIDEADGGADDRRILENEIANPRPLDELLGQVNDPETAEEVYLVSCTAVNGETPANRRYLDDLSRRLNLTAEQASEIEALA